MGQVAYLIRLSLPDTLPFQFDARRSVGLYSERASAHRSTLASPHRSTYLFHALARARAIQGSEDDIAHLARTRLKSHT